ncbi:MAG: NAD(P)H-dependent oxidoreductase [Patescibacteria group bacterium]
MLRGRGAQIYTCSLRSQINLAYIPLILGTGREGRNSEIAANFVLGEIRKRPEIETELIDVRDYRLEFTDNTETSPVARKLAEKVLRADGFIIVSPEYNHSYPGELKMMLDMLFEQYARKPVAICGVSAGGLGGVRMVEQLRLVAIEFHMVPVHNAVYFSFVKNLFDENGIIKDQLYGLKVNKLLDELVWYANALKEARSKEEI